VVKCGLTPEQFWDYSWYELDLVSERLRYHKEQQWDHTRHIMAALSGTSPQKILQLPTIDSQIAAVKPPSKEEQENILKMWQHTLKK